MNASPRPKPPAHLSAAARKWWKSVLDEYDLAPHHLHLLALAAQAWDRAEDARIAIAKHGSIYNDRFGAPRARPEIAIERDSRIAFARILRELDLDAEAPPEGTRPPSIPSNRG